MPKKVIQDLLYKMPKQIRLSPYNCCTLILQHKPSDFSCIVASSWLTNSVLKTFSIRHPLLGSSREYRKRYGYEDDMLKKHHRRQLHPSPRHGEDVTPKSCGERAVTQLQPPLALLPGWGCRLNTLPSPRFVTSSEPGFDIGFGERAHCQPPQIWSTRRCPPSDPWCVACWC